LTYATRSWRPYSASRGKSGVTGVVSGDTWLDEALIRVPLLQEMVARLRRENVPPYVVGGMAETHLWILPSGSMSNPANFGAVRGVPETLKTLSERAEILLVDAPPLLIAGDAMALTAHVDGIVVVIRANVTRTATLDELRRVLDVAPTAKLGFILTGSKDVGGYYEAGYGPAARDFTSSQDPGIDIDAQRNTQGAAMVTRDRHCGVRSPRTGRYASTRDRSHGGSQ
jgi:hypothetical protein